MMVPIATAAAEARATAEARAEADPQPDPDAAPVQRKRRGDIAFLWGLTGVALLLGTAVLRLGGRGLATLQAGLDPAQWLILAGLSAGFVYMEGFRAFQQRWVPRVVGRLEALRSDRRAWYRALAPLHAMGFISHSRRTVMWSWVGTGLIVLAILVVSRFPEPWRGIVDIAVAAALLYGTLALFIAAARSWRDG